MEGPELIFAGGHHRHEPRGTHASHHGSRKDSGWRGWFGIDSEGENVSKRDDGGAHERRKKNPQEGRRKGRRHERGHSHAHAHAHADVEAWRDRSVSAEAESDEEATGDGWEHGAEKAMGRRRQVVGMLVRASIPGVQPLVSWDGEVGTGLIGQTLRVSLRLPPHAC